MMDNNHEENVEEEDLVDEYYGSTTTPAELERINNHYNLGNDVRLNFLDPSLRDIPEETFYYFLAVTDLRVIQTGGERIILRTIGDRAFRRTRLRRINQFLKEGGVLRLGDNAFESCRRLEGELIIPSTVVLVGVECFSCTSITSVVFEPSGTVVEIQTLAFNECEELSSATLPPTLERIPPFCFGRCTALINMPIPSTVVEVGASAFADCTSLPSMDLPESVDTICERTFLNCTALTTVTIRTKSFHLRIGDNVFRGCDALSTLRMYPWHWGKLLSSMKNDVTFLDNFFNGTLTPLHQINLTSWYGARILEAVNDQPSLLYRVFRKFQHQRFETTTDRVDHQQEWVRTTATMAKHPGKRKRIEE